MEQSLNVAIASSIVNLESLSNPYLGLKYAYINGSPSSPLTRVSLDQLYGRYPRGSDTGLPVWVARDYSVTAPGSVLVFGPEPDSNYTVRGTYWGKPTVLRSFAADAAAHYLIVNAPDLCLYGALAEAEAFLKNDSRIDLWKKLYAEALQDYRDIQREEDRSGSPSQEVLA